MLQLIRGVPTRLLRRAGLAIIAIVVFFFTTLLLSPFDGSAPWVSGTSGSSGDPANQKFQPCASKPGVSPYAETWNTIKAKYDGLMDDKFTIAVNTFHRPKELKRTLTALLNAKIPSLYEIVVVWNNFDEETPASYEAPNGVKVRYRKPPRDSLNEKLFPDPEYKTQGILLSDDDVYYKPDDMEFVFQSWRKFGKDRISGALSRCSPQDGNGLWSYTNCAWTEDWYSMVLTNLAFAHVGFLDFFHSDNAGMTKIRAYVDEHFNCEDLGLNYAASLLTGSGPLLVRGRTQYVNLDPSTGISQKAGHKAARSACLNHFAEALQCMPLVDESARIERGYKHNLWYKSIWDRLVD